MERGKCGPGDGVEGGCRTMENNEYTMYYIFSSS